MVLHVQGTTACPCHCRAPFLAGDSPPQEAHSWEALSADSPGLGTSPSATSSQLLARAGQPQRTAPRFSDGDTDAAAHAFARMAFGGQWPQHGAQHGPSGPVAVPRGGFAGGFHQYGSSPELGRSVSEPQHVRRVPCSCQASVCSSLAAVQSWAKGQHTQHVGWTLEDLGPVDCWSARWAATGRLLLLHGCETVRPSLGTQCMCHRSTKPQPVASRGPWRAGLLAHTWWQIIGPDRLADCLSCGH